MQSLSGTLQTAYQSQDGMRHIPAAGKTTSDGQRASDCLAWGSDRPSTPERIKKYRTPLSHNPGEIIRHHGTAADAVPDGPFGIKSKESESAALCFNSQPKTEISKWKLDKSEQIYASNRTEALGKPMARGHVIPADMGTTRAFGMTYNSKAQEAANSTKGIIFPEPQHAEEGQGEGKDPRTSEAYTSKHGNISDGPGEQHKRNYDWQAAGIDPSKHAFGLQTRGGVKDGVKKCLAPGLDEEQQQPAPVVSKVYEDFKMTQADVLGRPKLLGARKQDLGADHVFGKPSAPKGGEPSAGEVMRGTYSVAQQAPDADLGKSLREGFRNMAPEGRVFGLPSIRTDARRPGAPSVANTMNYGNEPNAQQLLRPPATAEMGVNEEHYLCLRTREELQRLVVEAGLAMEAEEFDMLFAAAAATCGQEQYCSLDAFLRFRHGMVAAQMGV